MDKSAQQLEVLRVHFHLPLDRIEPALLLALRLALLLLRLPMQMQRAYSDTISVETKNDVAAQGNGGVGTADKTCWIYSEAEAEA